MRHPNEFDFEGAEFDAVTGLDFVEFDVVEHLVFVEAALDESESEFGAVDGDVESGKQEGDAANVIFVAVRQDQPANHFGVLFEIREVWGDDVHTE